MGSWSIYLVFCRRLGGRGRVARHRKRSRSFSQCKYGERGGRSKNNSANNKPAIVTGQQTGAYYTPSSSGLISCRVDIVIFERFSIRYCRSCGCRRTFRFMFGTLREVSERSTSLGRGSFTADGFFCTNRT